jgi:hypothetical protein
MKKCVIFAATLLLLVMVSCNQEIQNPAELFSVVNENTRAEKDPLDEIDFSALDTVFFVTDKDVEAYLYFKELLAKGRGQEFVIRDIIPMGLNNEVTLAYLLVYGQGWEIIAADKRAPVVLGGDPILTLPSKELPSEITAWIETLEYDVLYLRSFNGRPDVANDETWGKMLGSIDFWKSVNAETEYVEKKTNTTRVAPDDNPKYIPPGHWELESTDEYTEVLESVGPLVTVNFHQNAPFNNCCPYAYPYTTGRAVAGCTAVAGAQMAHYLHFYIGRPLLAPTNGYCNTNAYKLENGIYVKDHEAYLGINVSYSDQSSTIWSSMANYSPLASYLIADIGKRIFTDYGYDGSGANLGNLVAWYFIDNGVMCRDSTYDSGIVTASICDDMPVILGASANFNGQSVGHAFIADGWRKCRIRTENTYVWVWDEPSNIMPPASINTVITYGPIFQQLHMNWGWGAQYNGDTSWYAPTGNWIPDGRNFNLSRSMVWGFELFDE